ncbi:hypothetical protein V8D89_002492 [Ganoderma adspersum]
MRILDPQHVSSRCWFARDYSAPAVNSEPTDKKGPKDLLYRRLIAKPGKTPPLQYAPDYAQHFEAFGGREELDFADISDSWLLDRDMWLFVIAVSRTLMLADLSGQCGFSLDLGWPFSLEWAGIFSLSGRTTPSRNAGWRVRTTSMCWLCSDATNGVEDHNSEVQWWFDWNNDLGAI